MISKLVNEGNKEEGHNWRDELQGGNERVGPDDPTMRNFQLHDRMSMSQSIWVLYFK